MPRSDMKRRLSVAKYLAAAFGLAVAAVAGLVALTSRSAFERERARVAESLRVAAEEGAFWADELLPQVTELFAGLIEQNNLLEPVECRAALSGLQVLVAQGNISVFDDQGRSVCSLVEQPGGEPSEPGDWFSEASGSTQPVEHLPRIDAASGRPSTTVTIPLAPGGGRHGILAATLYSDAEPLAVPRGMPDGLVMLSTSVDGNLVLSASEGAPYTPGPAPRDLSPAGRDDDGPVVRLDPDGVERFYVESVAPRTGQHVLAGLPLPAVLGPARAELRTHLTVMAGIMAALVAVAIGLWRALVRPIRRLRRAIDASSTDDAVEAPVAGPAEVAAVARAFNQAIARRRQLENQLADQALHDPLTGLPNRVLLSDRLFGALARQRRAGTGLAGVAFLDLDRFKLLNDSHGHVTGDQVLVAVGHRLEAALRSTDTVARFGGDEFVIVVEALESQAALHTVAEKLLGALSGPITLGTGETVTVSASIGLTAAITGYEPVDDLLRDADTAMYAAKETRRGSFAVYDDGMRAAVLTRLEIEHELRGALAADEFVLDYQPKYDLGSGKVVGLEALIRWPHPRRGTVNPGAFIPVAEEAGLIGDIGQWVLRTACKQVRLWRKSGYELSVSVNVSAREFGPGFATRVIDILAETGAKPEDLCLEITEGTLISDVGATAAELAELRAVGVRVSIDDFGTGYSSLSYLHAFPADELKIDRSFVARLTRDSAAGAIVRAITSLAEGLGLAVVAEGAETAAEVELLKELGCQMAQGFHLCRPQPAAALADHLDRHARRRGSARPGDDPGADTGGPESGRVLAGVGPAGIEPATDGL